MGIKRNEETAKDLTIRRAINSEWPVEWVNSSKKLHYIKPSIEV